LPPIPRAPFFSPGIIMTHLALLSNSVGIPESGAAKISCSVDAEESRRSPIFDETLLSLSLVLADCAKAKQPKVSKTKVKNKLFIVFSPERAPHPVSGLRHTFR